jgi:hypothetical protein
MLPSLFCAETNDTQAKPAWLISNLEFLFRDPGRDGQHHRPGWSNLSSDDGAEPRRLAPWLTADAEVAIT